MDTPFVSLADHGMAPTHSGKVREILDLGDQLLLITTDRISAFDCILPTPIPGKGILLNGISNHWFRLMRGVIPNHLVSDQESEFPRDLAAFLA